MKKLQFTTLLCKRKIWDFIKNQPHPALKIILQDVDDNKLFFEHEEYSASLKENSDPGTVITQIIATDYDSPKNSKIYYSLSDNLDRFQIDKETGIIKSLKRFDYETTSKIYLKIFAQHPESNEFLASTNLVVNIEGVNEFYPKFKQPVFQFAVSEASVIGSSIGKIEADDYDNGIDGEINYFLGWY